MTVRCGDADALIAGPAALFRPALLNVLDVTGLREGVSSAAALQVPILTKGVFSITDTDVTEDPDPEQTRQSAVLAAEQVRRFGMTPKIALLSGSNFGSNDFAASTKMREALQLLHRRAPGLEAEGEMPADTALDEAVRAETFPNSRLTGQAHTLVLPDQASANIAYNMVKVALHGISVGPILLGLAAPAYVLHGLATTRGVLNMTAIATVEAQTRASEGGARESAAAD